MPVLRTLCVLLLLASAALGADVLPSAGKAVGFIRDDTPGFWLVLAQDFTPVEAKFFEGDDKTGYRGCVFEGPPGGRYMAIKIEQGRPKTFPLVLTGAVPSPVPVPPGPGPEPPPNPPPSPQPVVGPMRVLVLEETADRKDKPYTDEQKEAYLGAAFRSYCAAHASQGVPGIPDVYVWDDDFKESSLGNWVDLYKQAKTDSGANTGASKEPWLVIEQKGRVVYSGQIFDQEHTLKILQTFGGP